MCVWCIDTGALQAAIGTCESGTLAQQNTVQQHLKAVSAFLCARAVLINPLILQTTSGYKELFISQ